MNALAVQDAPAVAPPRPNRHRALRVLLIVLAVLVGIAVLVRLILDPIAAHETRKALDNLQGFDGDFSHVHLSVIPPSYTITHLKLTESRRGQVASPPPLLYVERARAALSLHDLLRGHLVASLRLEDAKVTLSQPAATKQKAPAKAPDLSEQLAQAPALRVARVELVGGQILVRTTEGDEHPRLWIHDLDVSAQDLGTRRPETRGRAATLSARGVVGRSGELTLFVSADPLAHPLSFAGQASVRGLRAAELYDFIAPKTDIQPTRGTIDLFATFRSEKGVISGGVKPVLKNLELRAADEGTWTRIKAWLADKAVELSSDRVAGRNAVATTVPIKGKLTQPDIQLWPAVLGVVRNAFVAGLESGFAHLPPPTSDQKQGVVEQAKNALEKKAGPPKAQPAGERRDDQGNDKREGR